MTFKLITLGAFAFVISLVISAPAHLAIWFLSPAIQPDGLQGTLLHGQARRLQIRNFDLGAVSWNLEPLYLLLGRIQSNVSVSQRDLRGHADVALGFDGFQIADAHLTGDTDLLAPYFANYGVVVSGRFGADIELLKLNEAGPQAAHGAIIWQNARLESPAPISLGEVHVALTQKDETAFANLRNTAEGLRLSGGAQVRRGWNYIAQLKIAPTAATPQAVRDTLPLLGQPDSNGAITLNQAGKLVMVTASLPW